MNTMNIGACPHTLTNLRNGWQAPFVMAVKDKVFLAILYRLRGDSNVSF